MNAETTNLRTSIFFAWTLPALGLVVLVLALAHCVSDQQAPVVALDGGTVVGEASVVTNAFSVSGTVSGLPASGTVTLSLNAGDALTAKDGMFVFSSMLLTGQSYAVTAKSNAQGYTCLVTGGTGTIAMANVTNVAVTCTSSDATLSSLTLSSSPLSPVFAPQTAAYTASIRVQYPFGYMSTPAPTTITATPNDPGATIAVNGVVAKAGAPSAPVTVIAGTNAIDVTVTASDKMTQKHYAIAASGIINDYIKASDTHAGENFGYKVALSNDGNTLAVGTAMAGSVEVFTRTGSGWSLQKRLTAINLGFGGDVALSADGNTLAVGAHTDQSKATGINGDQNDHSLTFAGAAYVLVRAGTTWTLQAYVKPDYTASNQVFGNHVAISADGNTLAVGTLDGSKATGIGGDETDASANGAGSVFVFSRTGGTTWAQQAYVKASNTRANAYFGSGVALSSDGNTLAVGSYGESSAATGVGANQADTSAISAGAVYVFARAGAAWSQQVYAKASNAAANAQFGWSLTISADGNTLAVGANDAGSAYVFTRAVTTWSEQAKLVAPNGCGTFGVSTSLSADGNMIAVGCNADPSNATGIDGNMTDTSAPNAGAVFVLTRAGVTWTEAHYVKASNTRMGLGFGFAVALSGDKKTLAAGDNGETSGATGINGNQNDTSTLSAGAVYVY